MPRQSTDERITRLTAELPVGAPRPRVDEAGRRAERLAATKRAVPLSRMIDYGVAGEDAARLASLAPDDQVEWSELAERLAAPHLAEADAHALQGRSAMARLARERAAALFNVGQLAFNQDNADKLRLYGLASECLATNAQDPKCDYARVELAANDGSVFFGWDLKVSDPIGSVVMFGGLSGWGASFLGLARALKTVGIRTILAEAPGQGETRMVSGLHLSRERLLQAACFVEHALAGQVPVALVGFSFGGLLAAHLAAALPSIAALCINGSPARIGALEHPAEREQFAAAFGASGSDLLRLVADFNFDPAREVLRCPVLSLEGGADPLVQPGTWRGFFGSSTGAAEAHVWNDGAHTLYNHAAERNALIGAWLSDCLERARRG